jgi:hypothetical protein
MRIALHIALSWFVAFFVCGAVLFPLFNPYFMDRVVLSAGLVGLMYGLESVVRAGHIETCGLLSGNCTQHTVRIAGFCLWVICFIALTVRHAMRENK